MNLTLERLVSDEAVTLGKLRGDGWMLCTLENPWIDNEPYISCIPFGTYTCKRVDSPRFGNTFQIMEVADRSHILFHWGNYEKDTMGCVLLGIDSNWKSMIYSSRKGFGQFIKHMEKVRVFELSIVVNLGGEK